MFEVTSQKPLPFCNVLNECAGALTLGGISQVRCQIAAAVITRNWNIQIRSEWMLNKIMVNGEMWTVNDQYRFGTLAVLDVFTSMRIYQSSFSVYYNDIRGATGATVYAATAPCRRDSTVRAKPVSELLSRTGNHRARLRHPLALAALCLSLESAATSKQEPKPWACVVSPEPSPVERRSHWVVRTVFFGAWAASLLSRRLEGTN